jgi:hypothetical protein
MSKEETRVYVRSLMGGYREDELKAAFDRVKDQKDWKAPVDAVVINATDEELARIKFAVEFYTAAKCELKDLDGVRDEVISRATLVSSAGYRMGPAGP